MQRTAEFIGFCGKKYLKQPQKQAKRLILCPKTSDLEGKNIRTFHGKHPCFVAKKSDVFGFPVGKCAKIPISPILQYFGTR